MIPLSAVAVIAQQDLPYKLIAFVSFGVLTVMAMRLPASPGPWTRRDMGFLAIIAWIFCWMRWPVIMYTNSLNSDEAQSTAQAIKVFTDIVPWRGFDPGTAGPLQTYVLALPHFAGIPLSIVTTHVVGTILLVLSAVAIFAAARELWGGRIASCAAIAYVAVEALTREADLVHTSTEYLPNALLACALWGMARIVRGYEDSPLLVTSALTGFALGSVPFAKLQSLPSAVLTALVALAVLSLGRRWACALALSVGVLAMPLLLVGSAAAAGAFDDFLISYIRTNAAYTSTGYGVDYVGFLFTASPFGVFNVSIIAFVFAIGAWFIDEHPRRPSNQLLFAFAFLTALLLVVFGELVAPHRSFAHYLTLLTIPASLLVAAGAAIGVDGHFASRRERARGSRMMIALAVAIMLVPQLYMESFTWDRFLGSLVGDVTYRGGAAAVEVSQLTSPGMRIAVWGWHPELYVFSDTVMATRDAIAYYQITPGPYRTYYRKRFMADFREHPPVLVVDDVAPKSFDFTDRTTQGLESFPELYQEVRKNYVLTKEIGGSRFFLRRSSG